MRFYKIDMQGKMWLQRYPGLTPPWVAADEGRVIYNESVGNMFLGGSANWEQIWTSLNDGVGSGLDADVLQGNPPGGVSGNIAINSGLLMNNLNADLLDNQQGFNYHDANQLTGFVAAARLTGTYNIAISGNAATATAAKYS